MTLLADPLILVSIAIAAFAGFRLWQSLGSRNEIVQPPPRFEPSPRPADLELKAVEVPPRETWKGVAPENSGLAKALDEIGVLDPNFDGRGFLDLAKEAHERVLADFAKGNLAALKPLLAENTEAAFAAEISRRKTAAEKVVFSFVAMKKAELVSAQVQDKVARIDVAFDSEVVSALKSAAGKLISGDEKRIVTIKELWSFGRDFGKAQSDWRLTDTHERT